MDLNYRQCIPVLCCKVWLQNTPTFGGPGGLFGGLANMDNCWVIHGYGCFEWEEYTVDLSSWVGTEDYVQPAFMLNYGGILLPISVTYPRGTAPQSVSGWTVPFVTLDNMVIEVTDTSGNSYIIEDENDVGYPYGANDQSCQRTYLLWRPRWCAIL